MSQGMLHAASSIIFGPSLDVNRQALIARAKALESDAEAEIEEIGLLLDELHHKHFKHGVNELAQKVLHGTSKVIDFIQNVANLHPVASAVVSVIKGAVALEVQHQENDAHIIVVHATMTSTIFHMSLFLSQIPSDEENRLKEAVKTLFTNIANTIHKFGLYVDAYHTHLQKTVKFLFAHLHKSKIQEFEEQFKRHKEEMDDMYKSVHNVQLNNAVFNTTEILKKLDEIRDAGLGTHPVDKFIKDNDGPDKVIKNDVLVDQVATLLNEKLTHRTRNILHIGFDVLLENHTRTHDMKCEARGTFLKNLESVLSLRQWKNDPHELIENQEFQDLWQENKWRSSVKCRILVEGIHEHYSHKLREQVDGRDDHWTLDFFSRAMYHSAIGDIIDDDGSGHITVLELNAFLTGGNRRRPDWTIPQWFAFWACGWYNNNAWYYAKIVAMMKGLEHSIERANLQPSESWDTVKGILGHLKPLILVADVEDFSGTTTVPHQLRRLQEEFREYEEQTIRDRLQQFGMHLVDKTSLMAVVEDSRIELHMMPLLYVLMKRLNELVPAMLSPRRCQHIHHEELIEIEEIATSCINIFLAFDARLCDLSRGWRFEGKDVVLQVDRYADGLFKKYYDKPWDYRQPYQNLCVYTFGNHPGTGALPQHLKPAFRMQCSAPVDPMAIISMRLQLVEDIGVRLQILEERLTKMDEKIDKMRTDPVFTILRRRLQGFWRTRKAQALKLKEG